MATIIDHIVRYDKGNPGQLEASVLRFSQALKPLSNLTDSEIVEMKNQLFRHAKEAEILSERLNHPPEIPAKVRRSHWRNCWNRPSMRKTQIRSLTLPRLLFGNNGSKWKPDLYDRAFLIPLRFLDENSLWRVFSSIKTPPPKGEKGKCRKCHRYFLYYSIRSIWELWGRIAGSWQKYKLEY